MTTLVSPPIAELTTKKPYRQHSARFGVIFLYSQFLGFYLFGGIRTIFPLFLELHLNHSETAVIIEWGFIFTIGQLIGFLTRIPMGIMVDRVSSIQSLRIGLLLSLIAIISMIFTDNIVFLALLFGLLRTGTHTFPLISRNYVAETDPKHHGRLNSYIFLAGNIGGIISPIILTFLLEISASLMIAITSLILITTLFFFNFLVPREEPFSNISLKIQLIISIKDIVQMKMIVLIYTITGIFSGIFITLQVPYAHYVLLLNPTFVGILVSFIQFLNLFLILLGGELIDRTNSKAGLLVGTIVEVMGVFCLLINTHDVIIFLLSQVLLQAGNSTMMTAATTHISHHTTKIAFSTTFGAITGMFFLGSALMPDLASNLFLTNIVYPYLIILVISLALLPLYVFYRPNPQIDK